MTMRHVLVTGGNKGIGKATCQLLLEEHADVHVWLGSRNAGRGQQAVQDIQRNVVNCETRLTMVALDTASDESVQAAATTIKNTTSSLYGIINNAGIMTASSDLSELLNVNYWGPRRVNDALMGILQKPGGRIVNVSSGSAPMFVAGCSDATLKSQLTCPWTIAGGIPELDQLAEANAKNASYGLSKALVSAYTWMLAKAEPDVMVNCITPGFIKTDMTQQHGATKPPSVGAIPLVWLCMSDDLTKVPTGRFYGSDCKRSPWHEYRDPGSPPYAGPEDGSS